MRLLFVADGPRDQAAIPRIVEHALNVPIVEEFRSWKSLRLSRGKGYERKLQFAIRQARDVGFDGVVATVDSDREHRGKRLARLKIARDADRQRVDSPPLATAIGEAVPHLEAWLLDDPVVIRDVLRFKSDKPIPIVRQSDPKASLDKLINESERTDERMVILREIATDVDVDRCNHSPETGLDEFISEVNHELAPLVGTST